MKKMSVSLLIVFVVLVCSCTKGVEGVGPDPSNVISPPPVVLVSGEGCPRILERGSVGEAVSTSFIDSEVGNLSSEGQPYRLMEFGTVLLNCSYKQQIHVARDAWGNLTEIVSIGDLGYFYNGTSTIEQVPAGVFNSVPLSYVPLSGTRVPADGTQMVTFLRVNDNEIVIMEWRVVLDRYEEILKIDVSAISKAIFRYSPEPHDTERVPESGYHILIFK